MTAKICPRCSREFSVSGSVNICPHDQSLLAIVVADPFIGQVIGDHYEVTEVLGQGGWSVVYKAHHQTIRNRHVAIKVLHQHLVRDPDKVLRFQREAEAAMSLTHPCVAAVYDYGVLPGGQPFIVMEYLEGIALSDILRDEGALSVERTLHIAEQVCTGLAVAHERNIIHRDVKPSNIFITRDGQGVESVKLLDFGLAKLLAPDEGQGNLTETGETMGTPDYMSPEQCMGMTLDARTDVYTMGYVLYEMLTGRQAVVGKNTFESMNLHIYEMPPPFAQVNPEVKIPDAIESVVFHALAKEPEERYQSALELRDALLEAGKKQDTRNPFSKWLASSRRKSLATRNKHSQRNAVAATVLIGCVAVAAAVGLTLHFRGESSSSADHAQDQLESWRALNTRGINAFNERDYVMARKSFEQAEPFADQLGDGSEQQRLTLKYLKDTYTRLGETALAAKVQKKMDKLDRDYYLSEFGRREENDLKIRELFRQLFTHPTDKKIASQLSKTLNDQCALAAADARLDEAEDLVQQALEVTTRVLGKQDPLYARCLTNMAVIAFDRGKKQDAEKYYKQALELREKVQPPGDPMIARAARNLAEYYRRTGDNDKALPLLLRSAEMYAKNPGKISNYYVYVANNLGITYIARGEFDRAEQWLNTALAIREQMNGKDDVEYARALCNLGQLNTLRKRYPDAEKQITTALAICERRLGPMKTETALAAMNLATLYLDMGKPALSERYWKRAYSVFSSINPRSDRAITAFQGLCTAYTQQNKIEDARKLSREVGEITGAEKAAAEKAKPIDAN